MEAKKTLYVILSGKDDQSLAIIIIFEGFEFSVAGECCWFRGIQH